MISLLRRLLGANEAPTPAARPEDDAQVAAAALLVEAALTDGVYAEVEQRAILTVIAEAFELSAEDAKSVLDRAEPESEAAIDAWRFTTVVKELPMETRLKLLEGLYRVANADGEACKFEDAYIRHVASLLHIEDVHRALARSRALGRDS